MRQHPAEACRWDKGRVGVAVAVYPSAVEKCLQRDLAVKAAHTQHRVRLRLASSHPESKWERLVHTAGRDPLASNAPERRHIPGVVAFPSCKEESRHCRKSEPLKETVERHSRSNGHNALPAVSGNRVVCGRGLKQSRQN